MLTLISRIDGLLQKMVDSAAFSLMRRFGWKKSFIQFCAGGIACAAVGVGTAAFMGILGLQPMIVALMLITAVLTYWVHYTYRRNASDEGRASIISAYDASRLFTLPPLKLCWFFFLIKNVVTCIFGQPNGDAHVIRIFLFAQAMIIALDLALLLEVYLVKTPRIPPPLEEKKTELVPAYATSRT